MRYSKEHKRETHARIVRKASVRLREKGAHGIGVADLIPDLPRKAARKQASATLATMMGALVLSRIAGNGEFSEEILAAGRAAALGRSVAAKSPTRKPAKAASARH